MNSQDWKRVRELFEACLDQPEAERAAFLEQSTAPPEVRAEALGLLQASQDNASVFEPPTPAPGADRPAVTWNVSRGEPIGQYTVERRIGAGGMADVFAATQERPSRRVALKILRGGLSERAIKRFQFESEVLGQLSHPAIAQVYDAGETTIEALRVPYIAMEYVDGAEDVIRYARQHALDRGARLQLFLEIAEAIRFGHERGVLHRDIKPSNLLVSADGHPKVIDYGIARAESQAAPSDHTLTGEVFGTLGYLAPERLRGEQAADTRSEVYSLGVVLFELLTDQLPVDLKGQSFLEAVQRMERQEPPRPSQIVPGLPEGLDWICLKALAIDRERRYSTVAELSADIQRYLAGEPVLAGAPSTSYRVRSWLRRNRVLAALVLLAVLGTVATVIGTRIGLNKAEEEALLAKRESQRAEREAEAAERQARLSDAAFSILEKTLKNANATQGGVDARISVVLAAIDREVGTRFAEEPDIATRMDTLLTTAYLGSRNLEDAERVLERAEARPEKTQAQSAELKLARAFVSQLQGDLPGAEALLREVIVELEGAADRNLRSKRLEATRGLIGALLSQGRFPDAVEVAQEGASQVADDLTSNARSSFYRLRGDALRMTGKLDEALASTEQAIAIARSDANETYELITGLRSAGVTELRRSHTKEASAFLEEAAQLAIDFLGEEHPETALTQVVLSDTYVRSGQYEKALAAFDRIQAMPAYQRMTKRNRILQLDNRAYVLTNLNRFEEALEASEASVALLDQSVGPADPIRLSCEGMRARLLIRTGRSEEGFAQLEKLRAAAESAHGPTSRMAIAIQQDLMQAYQNEGQHEKSLALSQSQIQTMQGQVPPEHSQLWNARQMRIEALLGLERLDEARAALVEIRNLGGSRASSRPEGTGGGLGSTPR